MKNKYLNEYSQKSIQNTTTKQNYSFACKKYHKWMKEKYKEAGGVFPDSDKNERIIVVQNYANYLMAETNYTPATIHTYLAPICKAYNISMKEIIKPKRTSAERVRSRDEEKNKQGKRELNMPKYKRLVEFARVVGIRRAEYKRLLGKDFIKEEGNYYVVVRKGKGGKTQKQLILPYALNIVLKTFEGVGLNEKVFSEKEMNNHIDLHGLRGDASYKAYVYYLERIENEIGYKECLIEMLSERWLEGHPKNNKKSSLYKKFMSEVNNTKVYKLRGENIYMAKKKGHPTEYNRLALMACSVFNLSHWRLPVTGVNYMT